MKYDRINKYGITKYITLSYHKWTVDKTLFLI